MSAKTALLLLFGKYQRDTSASDAVDWAVQELIDGRDSDALRRLSAITKPADWWEVEPLLRKSYEELEYPWLDPISCYWECAKLTARDIIAGEVSPSDGAAKMYQAYVALRYPLEMGAWLYICDHLHQNPYRELSADEFPAVVQAEAIHFLDNCPR